MLSFFVFLSDVDMKNYISLCLQVALTLNTAAAAAAVAIVDLAQNGNSSANWLGICQQFGDFCQKASGAVVASFIAAGVLLFLIVISALALRKRWQINSYWSCFLDFASGVLWSRWWLTDERFFFSLFLFSGYLMKLYELFIVLGQSEMKNIILFCVTRQHHHLTISFKCYVMSKAPKNMEQKHKISMEIKLNYELRKHVILFPKQYPTTRVLLN